MGLGDVLMKVFRERKEKIQSPIGHRDLAYFHKIILLKK